MSDGEWRKILSPERYKVMREGATERAFTGQLNDNYHNGKYYCPGCKTPLFSSSSKYDHGTGWPSFTEPIDDKNIEFLEDYSHSMSRIEVKCAVCGSHLGHVFNDGPAPSGKHYCINSASLVFVPDQEDNSKFSVKTEIATFAAGCFWGVEHKFSKIKGVIRTSVGYTGGKTQNPTYENVCSGSTGHAEAIEIEFNPRIVSYDDLVRTFFSIHDPTTLNRQGPDIGEQYRSAIFYHSQDQKKAAEKIIEKLKSENKHKKPIVTVVSPAGTFYKAEEYHQKYLEKKGRQSCGL
jgi:peptide methionine sulfoxide reductase msrA/msrB